MIDLQKTAEVLSLNFNKSIYFNIETKEFLITTNLEIMRAKAGYMQKGNKITKGVPEYLKCFLEDSGPYIPLFNYKDKDFKEDIEMFYKEVLLKPFEDISISKFKKILKENAEIFEKWISYFSKSISFEFYFWTVENGIKETEASKEQYKIIRELFLDIHSKDYTKYFSDRHLFYLPIDYDQVHFVFMGNAGITDGISFYLNELGESYYKFLMSSGTEEFTAANLSQCFTLYYDGSKKDFDKTNPYGEDCLVTSLGFDRGVQYNCYLPKSLAHRIIKYLNEIKNVLPIFLKSKEFKKIDVKKNLEISLHQDIAFVHESVGFFPECIHFDFQDNLAFEPKGLKVINKSMDFTMEAVLDNLQPFETNRISLSTYVILMAEHGTEKIEEPIFEEPAFFFPFLNAYDTLYNRFKKEGLPKTIYISSSMTYGFLIAFLRDYVDSGKVTLIPAGEELFTDAAFAGLNEIIHQEFAEELDIKA